MSYLSIDNGVIVRHQTVNGRAVETPLPTAQLRCQKCGWTTKAVQDAEQLPPCICGGVLQTVDIKNAKKGRG